MILLNLNSKYHIQSNNQGPDMVPKGSQNENHKQSQKHYSQLPDKIVQDSKMEKGFLPNVFDIN